MTLAQLVTSCIIINAFNRLLASPAIRDHVGAFLLQLQSSVIRASFAEPQLLTDAAHPVRVSLDRLTEFAIAQPRAMQPGQAIYESIAVIIDCVAGEAEYDSVAYASVADNISELFAYEEETAAAGDTKAAMMMEIEITEIAINAATRAIEVRLEHDESTPEFVATFVRVIWKDVLFQDVINGGGKGELWLRDIETLDTLLKSIHAQESVGARSEMLRRLPVLMGNLEEGAQSVGCDPAYLTAFVSQLRELHTAAWNAPFETAGPPLAHTGDDAAASTPPGLRRGEWVEFSADGGKTRRARLNWLSPIGGNYLFKDYLKNETFTVDLKELNQQLSSGRAQLVRSLGISRHAIEYAIKHLGDADAR